MQRRDASDLAGIGVSVFSDARARRAGADRAASAAGAVLITGAVRVAEPVNPADPAAYNSIYVIDHDGSILALYDKVHLVPFGEYLPFKPLLERLGMQTARPSSIGGFLAGDRRRLIAIPGAPPALPLICYEIIFPGEVVPPR